METKDEDVLTQEISKDKTYRTLYVHRENCLMNIKQWDAFGVFPQSYINSQDGFSWMNFIRSHILLVCRMIG